MHENLPLVLFAYNSSKHESTGFSPFELMFGQNPASPLNNFKERLISKQDAIKDRYQLMLDTRNKIVYSIEMAKQKLIKQSSRHRVIKNKHRQLRRFEPNQQVLVLLPNENNENIWQGPYYIEDKLSEVTYNVNIKGNVKKLHIDKLSAYGDNKGEKQTINVISKENDENDNTVKKKNTNSENISSDIPDIMKIE